MPGSIQVFTRYEDKPAEKLNEIQAHAGAVSKLRLSPDSQNLFSAGKDSLICIFDVRDRDPRNLKPAVIPFAEQILSEQSDIEK